MLHAFSLDCRYGSIAHTTGRLAHTIVQGNCLFRSVVKKLVNSVVLIECADLAAVRKKYFEERSLYSLFRNVNPEKFLTI